MATVGKSPRRFGSGSVMRERGDGLVGVVSFARARLSKGELYAKFEGVDGWLYRWPLAGCGLLPPDGRTASFDIFAVNLGL